MSRKPKLEGSDVAARARKAQVDSERRAGAEMAGKKSHFTPSRLDHLRRTEELEEGQVVGVLDTDLAGDETELPPGRYNLFLRKGENDQWEAVAEADGRIVAKAARATVRIEKERPGAAGKTGELPLPEFRERGWCWCWWTPVCGFWVLICVCW